MPAALSALVAVTLAGCSEPEPRSFNDFLHDPVARDGALARCNQDRDASLRDIECANARRAAAAVAVREERERRAELERESERKLEAIRKLVALQQQREREAAEAAAAAAAAAYDLQWEEQHALGGSATEPGSAEAAPVVSTSPSPALPPSVSTEQARSLPRPTTPEPAPSEPASTVNALPASHAEPPPPAAAIPRPFRPIATEAAADANPLAAVD